ncbi:MAG: hypothetical protein ACTS4V_00305 [Candidatus Hodgkinia cicadicola]
MVPRFNLTKGTFLPLSHCIKTPQGQLFSDSFHDSADSSQDSIPSKLKLELTKLFPIMFDCRVLELDNVNVINEIESPQLQINLTLKCSSFETNQSYSFIKSQSIYNTHSFNIPKLSEYETISLCDMDKVFVSQLIRCPAIHLNISPPTISIVITSGRSNLEISSNCEVCSLTLNGSTSEWVNSLLTLGAIPSQLIPNKDSGNIIHRHESLSNIGELAIINGDIFGFKHSIRPNWRKREAFEIKMESCNESDEILTSTNTSSSVRAYTTLKTFDIKSLLRPMSFDVKLDEISKVILSDFIVRPNDSTWLTKRDLIELCFKLLDCDAEFDESLFKVRATKSASDALVQVIASFYGFILSPTSVTSLINLWRSGKPDTSTKLLQSRINNVLSSSGLCQFADQTNSLAELSHRLRLTYMGPGGVTSRSAELSLREIQRWYFGKVCPIESPEGQGIGLVNEFAMGAIVDKSGHIASPYSKTYDGLISNQIACLNHFNSKRFILSSFWAHNSNYAACVVRSAPLLCHRNSVNLNLISGSQLFSVSVNLIPFLHHNDPTRALMAANMYKQAIPLINPSPPLVGTGYENAAIVATCHNILATSDCYVISADSNTITVYDTASKAYKTYNLPSVRRTNQDTCFRVRNVVKPGQFLKSGDAIAECQSSSGNEMSLGVNLNVAFMCWGGFNYEDSVVLSEDVVARGLFQSIHVLELSAEVLETAYGNEILTNKISSISSHHLTKLSPAGLISIGATVTHGDVLVGKLTPTVSTQFESAGDIVKILNIESTKDSSIYVPSNIENATVIDVSFTDANKNHQSTITKVTSHIDNALKLRLLKQKFHHQVQRLCVHNFPTDELNWSNPIGLVFWQALNKLFESYNEDTRKVTSNEAELDDIEEAPSEERMPLVSSSNWTDLRSDSLGSDIDDDNDDSPSEALSTFESHKTSGDVVLFKIKVKLLTHRSIQAGDKVSGRHGNKGVISRIVPREDMPYTKSGMPLDIILNPLGVPSRMNIGQILETQLGLIVSKWGNEFAQELKFHSNTLNSKHSRKVLSSKLSEVLPTLDTSDFSDERVIEMAQQFTSGVPVSCPPFSKITEKRWTALRHRARITNINSQVQLYDGLTGKPFNKKTTVGKIYIFKLNHMVEDKMYFRSTGPYSSLTQQPTKGKARKGGQRMGEMEVWALQAHGAAFLLKEASTLKGDDVAIRSAFSPVVIASKLKLNTTWGESFLLLLTELKSLCIEIVFNKPAHLEFQ